MIIKSKLSQTKIVNVIFFTLPLILFLMVEYAARGDIKDIIGWASKEPLQLVCSLGIFYEIYILLWAVFNNMGAAAVSFSAVCILLSAAAGCKREILGVPLMPWDIKLGRNISELLQHINHSQLKFLFSRTFILFLIVIISGVIGIFIMQRPKMLDRSTRIRFLLLSLAAAATVIMTLPKVNLEETTTGIFEKKGYIRGLIMCTKLLGDMDGLGAEAVSENFNYEFTSRKATSNIKPNVIFIMSEAFWDCTQLPNVTYSEDPIPNFHALSRECISGEIVSPTYGGLTSNVEFEIMTGFSLKYLPYQTNAYMAGVKRQTPALPSYFKSIGYQTIGVHPYSKTFFDRDRVYPWLGIDRFVTESDMKDAKTMGNFISDESFADYIISEFKKASKPVFMYNISMQNHWPYSLAKYYKDNRFTVKSTRSLDMESATALQNYAKGIHDADKCLKKITDYFKTIGEPTVVVFLGDHLPALTEELGVYKKLGYIDEAISDEDLFKVGENSRSKIGDVLVQNSRILKTPYLIWFNYKTGMEKGKTLSANYLGIYTMNKIGLELPPFYNFLLDYSNKVPVNRHFLSIIDSGAAYRGTPAAFDDYENMYKSIQYNILFGNQNKRDLFLIK